MRVSAILARMRVSEKAYAAGIIDGEGCITGNRSGLRVVVSTTTVEMVEWLEERFGGAICTMRKQPPRRDQWQWSIYGRNASRFLDTILPYLVVKRDQAELGILLDNCSTRGRNRWNPLTDEERAQRESLIADLRAAKA